MAACDSVAAADRVAPASVPADAVTAAASGLDPDISPGYAREQAARVARARGLAVQRVLALVDAHTQAGGSASWVSPRVNVLQLNLALARLS